MSGKRRGWHRAWSRLEPGLLQHESGLQVRTDNEPRAPVEASLAPFSASEMARGVPAHDIEARLARLLREAGQWRDGIFSDHLAKP